MSRQFWIEPIAASSTDSSAIANTTTETALFPSLSIPANYLQDGRILELEAFGKLSTTSTPTMQFALRLGGVSGVVLAQTEAITMGSAVSNVNWHVSIKMQVRTNGASGKVLAFGDAMVHTSATAVATNVFGISGYDAPAEATVDLTATADLTLTAKWGTANASNTITGMMLLVKSIN